MHPLDSPEVHWLGTASMMLWMGSSRYWWILDGWGLCASDAFAHQWGSPHMAVSTPFGPHWMAAIGGTIPEGEGLDASLVVAAVWVGKPHEFR